jgi:hypothetical protein
MIRRASGEVTAQDEKEERRKLILTWLWLSHSPVITLPVRSTNLLKVTSYFPLPSSPNHDQSLIIFRWKIRSTD